MGFYYRKSKSFGPFRINLSKSGVGYSVGGKGFRTGISGSGRKYTTFNIPGTGLGYRTSGSGGRRARAQGQRGCAVGLALVAVPSVFFLWMMK
jgi:hypothetical protein